MGRHFRNLGHRDVITMKPSDVRRSICAGDLTKKPISPFSLVQKAVIIVSLCVQCGNCPKGYYQEDYAIDSRKQCSLCCEGRWYAESECSYLRQFRRKDCGLPPLTMAQQLTKKTCDIDRLGRSRKMFPSFTKAADEIKQQVITHSATENVGFGVQNVISSHENQEQRFKRETNQTLQQVHGCEMEKQNDAMIRLPSCGALAAVCDETVIPLSLMDMMENASWQTGTRPLRDAKPTAELAPSYVGDVKKLFTILITLVAIVLPFVVFIACVLAFICWKKIQPTHLQCVSRCPDSCFAKYVANDAKYLPMLYQSKIQTDNGLQDVSYSSGDVPGSTNLEARLDVACLPGILLSEMPLDLKEKIARKLNVCRQGECLCGWEKLGNYFDIEEDILHDLDNEYKSKAGSPSVSLLDILGTRGKTIPDLVNAARSLTVNCPDIAGLIEDYQFKSWKPKDLLVSQWMNE